MVEIDIQNYDCIICLENTNEDDNKLIKMPCNNCKGSVGYIHEICLEDYLDNFGTKCTICNTELDIYEKESNLYLFFYVLFVLGTIIIYGYIFKLLLYLVKLTDKFKINFFDDVNELFIHFITGSILWFFTRFLWRKATILDDN